MKKILFVLFFTISYRISYSQPQIDCSSCQTQTLIQSESAALSIDVSKAWASAFTYCYETEYYCFYQIIFRNDNDQYYLSADSSKAGYVGGLVYILLKNNYSLDFFQGQNGFFKIMVFKKYKKEDQILQSLQAKIDIMQKDLNMEISNSLQKVPQQVQAEWSKIVSERLDTLLSVKLDEIKAELIKTINSKPTDYNGK